MNTPPLNTALAAGNAKVCLELLNKNANVQWKHHDGATPLHVAVAWIASSHNSNLRLPPVGEEPRAVIAMILHNGADPTQTEGMTKSAQRATGMTPLESFLREVSQSPWRNHEELGAKFDQTAKMIHTLLEQGEKAVKLKKQGNTAFGSKKYEEALKAYAEARSIWKTADIRGHHTAVLWSNEATCHKKMEDWEGCRQACQQGLTHFCAASIRTKLEDCLKEAEEQAAKAAARAALPEEEREKLAAAKATPAVPRRPPTKLQEGFLAEEEAQPLYGPEGSRQGTVVNPGPFICNFNDAQEAGFVDGVDGWKDRKKLEEHALDQELVREGLMAPDLLDSIDNLDLINRQRRES